MHLNWKFIFGFSVLSNCLFGIYIYHYWSNGPDIETFKILDKSLILSSENMLESSKDYKDAIQTLLDKNPQYK